MMYLVICFMLFMVSFYLSLEFVDLGVVLGSGVNNLVCIVVLVVGFCIRLGDIGVKIGYLVGFIILLVLL